MGVKGSETGEIRNAFWHLGPNVTGYPGGFPNGLLERLRASAWWGPDRLHVCSGSVQDGVTCDINPDTRPSVVCRGEQLPFASQTFDTVVLDPPYSASEASELYDAPAPSVPSMLDEACRVTRPGGYFILLHRHVFMFRYTPDHASNHSLIAVYHHGRGLPELRALQVWMRNTTQPQTLARYTAAEEE